MTPARLAVVRWALRLFRREWRQQALVLALLTLAVAAAIGFATATYNTVGVPENAVFGTANHRLVVSDADATNLATAVAAAREHFGAADGIARWTRPLPGSVESLEYRAQDPAGAFSGPMLARVDGRYPSARDETAVTDGVAEALGLDLGGTLDLDGTRRTVVGIVENPSDLGSDFALVAPGDDRRAESITLLVGGRGSFDEVRDVRAFGVGSEVTTRDDAKNGVAAVAVLGVGAIALALVALVAAAGFLTVAQRRLRQLGMFQAVGATDRQARLVVVANGAAVGAIAAVAGTAIGMAAWVVAAPRMEEAVGHRIDPANVPWWIVVSAAALVILAASIAAWWPARVVARVPIVRALSGRPSHTRPGRPAAVRAAALGGAGIACLVVGGPTNPVLGIGGTVATVCGVLLLSPLAIRALAGLGRRLPIAMRLPLRDLVRHHGRSGVALAAISLALGIPAAIVVTATAAEHEGGKGNVSDSQLLIWTRDASQPAGISPMYTRDPDDEGFSPYLPRLSPAQLDAMRDQVGRVAAALDGASVAPLDVVIDRAAETTPDGRLIVTLAQPTEIGYLDVAPLFVATPALLEPYGVDVDDSAEVLTVEPSGRLPDEARALLQSDDLWFANASGAGGATAPAPVPSTSPLDDGYTSLPGSFVTAAAQERHGWESVTVGWLLQSRTPFTLQQLRTARRLAADAGLLVESRREQVSLVALRWGATAAGLLLALGVLAMTVGLIRGEGSRDLRTLAATGAGRATRRTLTATTAGGLAVLGALVGTVGSYLTLGAARVGDLATLTPVPVLHLLVILLGVPAVAAAAGWLLAGREPRLLARQALE